MGLSADDLAILLDSFEGSEWTELVLSIGGTQVALTKEVSAGTTEATPRKSARDVVSPSVGIFRRGPEPDAPPFAEVGDRVEPDQVIAVVQVLKLVVDVKAGASGTVQAIHVADGDMVEYGQPLLTLDDEG